jgi:hypothetical protein
MQMDTVIKKDLDRVIVRENSEGEYAGHPWSGFRHHSKGVANPIGAFLFSLSVRVNDRDLLLGNNFGTGQLLSHAVGRAASLALAAA